MIPPILPPPVLSLSKGHRIEIGDPAAVTVILAGCGGTGSFAALHLARLAYEARRGGALRLDLIFCDPDTVEAKNIGRQNFAPAEIGLPKAVSLASRYNLAFGLEIRAAVATFAAANLVEAWSKAVWRRGQHLLLIAGCVDSPAARREIEAAVTAGSWAGQRDIWWLDAGNDEHSGQVLLGNGAKTVIDPTLGCVALPWPSVQEAGIVAGLPVAGSQDGLSCAELMALNAQSLMINQAMAGWLATYAYRLLLGRDLDIYQTWLDLRGGNVRSVPITEGEAVAVRPAKAVEAHAVITELQELIGGAVGHCPECQGLIFEGRDVLDAEVGEIDVVFCPACNWRMDAEAWQVLRDDAEAVLEMAGDDDDQAHAAMVTGVRERRAAELGLVEVVR